jgi:Pyridoxamine 5'-phosphate oxidase
MAPIRRLAELTRQECLGLLGSVPYGRVVFTSHALPAIRPVNHILVGQKIIVRTTATAGAAIASAVDGAGTVVAYEADLIDAEQRLGWSVVVVGRANRVLSAAQIARYREALIPWTDADADEVITIAADVVTGYRMISATAEEPGTYLPEVPAI